jgi:hypothetical protein
MAARRAVQVGCATVAGAVVVGAASEPASTSWGTIQHALAAARALTAAGGSSDGGSHTAALPGVPQPTAPAATPPTPATTTVVVQGGSGGVSWKLIGLVGGGAAAFVAWKRWNGYSWDDVAYVTRSTFNEGVEALEGSVRVTSEAVATARAQLTEQLRSVETQLRDTGEELELKIEREVGLARDDIGAVSGAVAAAEAAVADIGARMATGAQVSELSELVVETSKTARHTSGDVRALHANLEHVAEDVASLKRMVSQQTEELRGWMRSQIEDVLAAKLPGQEGAGATAAARRSEPASPPGEPSPSLSSSSSSAAQPVAHASFAMLHNGARGVLTSGRGLLTHRHHTAAAGGS